MHGFIGDGQEVVCKVPIRFRTESEIRDDLEGSFEKLKITYWKPKSFSSTSYQCIAWAACRTDVKWWPPLGIPLNEHRQQGYYWPETAPDDDRVIGFVTAFSLLGYVRCDSFDFEKGFQKVAIFAKPFEDMPIPTSVDNYQVKHMARQRFLERSWLSKLGDLEDIVHRDVRSVECPLYGQAVVVLKRSWCTALRFGILNSWKYALVFWWKRLTSIKGWPRIEDDLEQW
jgi:hypothetical protein